jgi:fructose-1,6-bisphosphatase I
MLQGIDVLQIFLQIPKKGKIYSVNEGNAMNWDKPTTL